MAIIIFFFATPKSSNYNGTLTLTQKALHMDLPGAFIFLAAMTCILLALQWGGTAKAWSDPDVFGTIMGFGLLILAFLVVEWFQGERALLVPYLLKERHIWAGCIFEFLYATPLSNSHNCILR